MHTTHQTNTFHVSLSLPNVKTAHDASEIAKALHQLTQGVKTARGHGG